MNIFFLSVQNSLCINTYMHTSTHPISVTLRRFILIALRCSIIKSIHRMCKKKVLEMLKRRLRTPHTHTKLISEMNFCDKMYCCCLCRLCRLFFFFFSSSVSWKHFRAHTVHRTTSEKIISKNIKCDQLSITCVYDRRTELDTLFDNRAAKQKYTQTLILCLDTTKLLSVLYMCFLFIISSTLFICMQLLCMKEILFSVFPKHFFLLLFHFDRFGFRKDMQQVLSLFGHVPCVVLLHCLLLLLLLLSCFDFPFFFLNERRVKRMRREKKMMISSFFVSCSSDMLFLERAMYTRNEYICDVKCILSIK